MGYERFERAPKLDEMISFICNYKPTNRKKMIDHSWLIKQNPDRIYAIYFEFLEDYQMRAFEDARIDQANQNNQEVEENQNDQITFDDIYPELLTKSRNSITELSDEEMLELLALSHEAEEEYTDDYYDDYGRLMGDAKRMERRENARIRRRVSGISNQ